ncbi:hypothetical protein [Latilactobacillus fuchuensis]|uniref:Uncharacterized protein n=2 Tax=Latilactobacillus fuchuensis TaxID=164393 RepID=A0A2N9DVU6_9LACO|nr:hypothetical protein [Latilactobacillus fuchuensis]KRL58478.1 hypothetical protein FC69_GL000348 [Latilactobacillus fuchuensis DSM 14340 = JCM 11249]MCP8857716.1 hypothetical protein [Latilactobacillus fuchuensis]SPC38621.1 conserved hypothetical protein [Latilactobacillus fuchuensis]
MIPWVIALLTVILLIGLVSWIRRLKRRRAMRILQKSSQTTVDELVNIGYQRVSTKRPQFYASPIPLRANLPTEVWGGNVMVFEYQVPIVTPVDQLEAISTELEETLNAVAYERRIASVSPRYPALMITDAWLLDQQYHFDVAFIVNRETIEYVKDMARV